jgi:hypothetical protein
MSTPATDIESSAASNAREFIDTFRALWASPTVEGLDALMHPDVRYSQPLLPDVVGSAAAHRYWRRMFLALPDLHLTVVNSAVCEDNSIYVGFVINATLGRRRLEVPAVDHYQLDTEGQVLRRVLYCDSLAMTRAVLHPTAWLGLIAAEIRITAAAAQRILRSWRARSTR